ncbi:hypothetical protein AVEN_115983-1 [Araneus ventricosus]|uniref:Uncharacterized protein n=1 Tax=Araneus ventricosus TaxID=182803 RepID=A0A4Y2GB96_ARAVE|nr:hypothetical protein AVEN_227936-1 [Araneus ventricosus]GBM50893.1 hypothetical protein AVEN_115983-1 [Araneus ventricosus]
MFSLPASTVPTRKRVQYISCQPQTAGQLHMVVLKETFARVIAPRRKRPQCRGINICQRAHWVGFEEISGALSCHTCIAPVVRKLKNLPSVGADHWEYGSLVVGRPGRRLSNGVKGMRSSIP